MNYSNYQLTLKDLKENKEYFFSDPNGTLYSDIVIKKEGNNIYLAHYSEMEDGTFEIESILDDEPTCYVISENAIDLCPDIFEKDFYSLNIGEFYGYCFSVLYELYCDLSKGIPINYKDSFKEIKSLNIFTFNN